MREHGIVIPVAGLKSREHSQDGHAHLGNLIAEDGYWRVPESAVYSHADRRYWSELVQTDNLGNVYYDDALATENAGAPYGFAPLMGQDWLLSCMSKIVYRVGNTIGAATNSDKMQCVCSHFRNRLIWNTLTGLHWSTVGVKELAEILAGSGLPSEYRALNQAGSVPFRNITAIHALAEHVVVYAADRLCALRQTEGGRTYGVYEVRGLPPDLGLHQRSVCATDDAHLFVGTDRNLWRIDPNLQATNVGYSWLLEDAEEEE